MLHLNVQSPDHANAGAKQSVRPRGTDSVSGQRATCSWQPSDWPRAPCPPTTVPSIRSARGWTRGLESSEWPWGSHAKATTSNLTGMAKALSLAIPQTLLQRADQVIQ